MLLCLPLIRHNNELSISIIWFDIPTSLTMLLWLLSDVAKHATSRQKDKLADPQHNTTNMTAALHHRVSLCIGPAGPIAELCVSQGLCDNGCVDGTLCDGRGLRLVSLASCHLLSFSQFSGFISNKSKHYRRTNGNLFISEALSQKSGVEMLHNYIKDLKSSEFLRPNYYMMP